MRPRASWWEILGAWLRVWTPPRDVEIPSPRRGLKIGVPLAVAVAVVVVVFVAPAINSEKDRNATQEAQAKSASRVAFEKRLAVEQRPQYASAPEAARRAARGQRAAALAVLVKRAQTSISRDARARVAAGKLTGHIR